MPNKPQCLAFVERQQQALDKVSRMDESVIQREARKTGITPDQARQVLETIAQKEPNRILALRPNQ